ncbi:hypothetical protein V1502_04780 [Bacillus sp. SCS-153A]|uniref:hypothetical protein n=1 Tax=Rossellomorea sedimentorum TaxID=3115294 RepID=UPI00390587C1
MEKAIKLLVWGLLILLIDIKINTFDLVHDVFGYILLYKGLQFLPHSKWALYAKTSAIILALLSVFEVLGVGNINLNEIDKDFTWSIAAVGIISIIALFFHMNLLSALLFVIPNEDIQSSVGKFRRFYFGVQLMIILTLPATLVLRDMAAEYLIFIIISGLIVEIFYIVNINSFKQYIPSSELLNQTPPA